MDSWADDVELVATFRAEVLERLASLRDGLLHLEQESSPRQLVASLFRDAHTVKGSARMLGLDDMVALAHRSEDLLGQLRDGRLTVRRDLVDVLLVTGEALGRLLPGADRSLPAGSLQSVTEALDAALAGVDPIVVPRLIDEEEVDDDSTSLRGSDSVRVPARRVHGLLDIVGEAELEVRTFERHVRSLLTSLDEHTELVRALRADTNVGDTLTALVGVSDRLLATARDLRSDAEDATSGLAKVRTASMGLAMVPVRRVVAGFPALVREIATAGGKDVNLEMTGVEVELDVRVLDGVADALRHLVTNAIDHGCEAPTKRRAAGKSERSNVSVAARQAGSTVVLEVSDDGAGIDIDVLRERFLASGVVGAEGAAGPALLRLLFEPGVTTADDVTTTSGRGVGLDVVRTAVESLGGTVEIMSVPGEGTTFVLSLPVTLGVLRCLLVDVSDEAYALPLGGILETVALDDALVSEVAGVRYVTRGEDTIPLRDLPSALGLPVSQANKVAIVFRGGGHTVAWTVDALVGEREVVVKSLGEFLGVRPGIAGATIDDDGHVVLLLDLKDLRTDHSVRSTGLAPAAAPRLRPAETTASGTRPRVLLVEDSTGVRELQRTILEGAGYAVQTAVDGLDGAQRLAQDPVDLVLSDVEMPGMDGFTLTRTIRKTRGWENVPVVIMTSRGDDADKRAGLDAGADAYLLKSEFDQHELIETVRRLVGR